MKSIKVICFCVLVVVQVVEIQAKEGMWMPVLIEKLNYEDLKAKGFKLTPEDIYSLNNASLKDAVVIFGGGCTGEIISGSGLLVTNHHCAAGYVQRLSTVNHNYLRNGFWAMNKEEELPAKGLSVKFLANISEITDKIEDGLDQQMTYTEQLSQIDIKIKELEKSIEDTSEYRASIESFYAGNAYYLFLYKEYSDIRLVGAPPESIGGFGGDTDNWVWPRHSGDFSIFRIYSDKDGEPAIYSTENIPLKPKTFLKISMQGFEEDDFTMVLGYPGYTNEYIYSKELKILNSDIFPNRIKLRDGRIMIIDNARKLNEEVNLQYAVKQSKLSNNWKKWKGIQYGFYRFDAINEKLKYEDWLMKNSGEKEQELMQCYKMFDDVYDSFKPYYIALDYYIESISSLEPIQLIRDLNKVVGYGQKIKDLDDKANELVRFRNAANSFFKNYNSNLDKNISFFLLRSYINELTDSYIPGSIAELVDDKELSIYINHLYSESVFTDSTRFYKAFDKLQNGKTKMFVDDPYLKLYNEFNTIYQTQLYEKYSFYYNQIQSIAKDYMLLIQEIDTVMPLYPDANFTMRMAYGKIEGYSPSDAVNFKFQSFFDGVIQKNSIGISEYQIPQKLIDLYVKKDYGRYANEQSKLPVCFIAANHTSGGNSGSPVLNAKGHLIGINFDRNWEGTMSDYYFDERICRNISLDVRYLLFIIDKFAGAGYLLDEMELVW